MENVEVVEKGQLIAVIGDEDTCVGFLLGGIGEVDEYQQPNFLVVNKGTPVATIEETFKSFLNRKDIAMILICQNVADMIRKCIDVHSEVVPTVLEIPTATEPYDMSKDSILHRARDMIDN